MPHGDDLDQRFNELVAQIDAEQRRKMRAAAKKGAKASRRARNAERERLRPAATTWEDAAPRRGGRRMWPALAGVTAVVTAASLVLTLRPGLLTPAGAVPEETMPVAAPLAAEPAPEETMPASMSAGPVPEETTPVRPTAQGPFAGSPAEGWAEGADGFTMPKAKATGGLPAKDVAKGIERTRALLAAAHLDRKTLFGGHPAAFVKLLPPDERSWFTKRLDRAGRGDTRSWVTSFAPKTAERAGDVVKVRGRTKLSSFRLDGRRGAKLETDYIIVHAVQRPGQPDTAIRLVTRKRGTFLVYREAGELVVWVRQMGGSATPARCDVDDAYIHPFYADSAPSAKRPEGAPVDPYDLDAPDPDGDCHASKGT
ncbi:hypothetical protein ACU635_46490 [[Actinomadura] parvosata]|uniref:hypothetical protein n=1 Tax=[Actinomadura] parvosata TaxID=1955412 RepID=UPI00406C45C3